MADPAFDAFSQRRDTGTKDRVTERRRVDTYTDPNRYQMPPRRRLGVHASNKSMFVTPEKENITAFAEGLAEVKPAIMNHFAEKEIEKNKQDIQYGIQEAMGKAAMDNGDTEFVDNEWRQFGFEQKKAMMAGEELSAQLAVDVQTKDPMVDFDPWYQDWYATKMEEFPHLATMDPEHLETYNKPVQKGVAAAKNQAIVDKENEVQRQYVQVSTDYTKKTIEEAIENGYEVNNELIEQIINDEINMSRWGRDKANDIIFNSIKDIAIENNDASLLDYFDERRGDGSIPPVSTMRATEIEAIEATIERNIDAQTRAENAQITADNKFITDNQKLAKDELTIMIGAPEDFGGMAAIEGISPADRARVARKNAMDFYRNTKNDLKINEGYSEAEAHAEALERTKNSPDVQQNLSGAYSESERKKGEAYKSSANFVTSLQDNLEDGYSDYVADLYEAQGIQKDGSSVGGVDLATIIPEWHSLDKEHQKLLLADGKKYSKERAIQAEKDKKAAEEVVDAQVTAAGIQPEDNTPVTVRSTPEEDKAFEDMYAAGDEKAGKLDFSEEDRPEYTEGYEARHDDNQGLKPGGIEYISEERPTQVEGDGFGDSIFGDIIKGVGDAFGAIYNYDGPSPISVDPQGQDSVEYDYTTRNTDGSFSVKPKVWSPGDKKYVTQTPDVNTNSNIATITPEDVSEKNSFKEQLKMSESSNDYSVVNSEGFKGAYQFGDSRLKDFKNSSGKTFTTKQFLKNPKLQDEVFEWHVNDIRETIVETGTTDYIGKTIKGIPVTMKGLIAVAHLGGKQGMIDFVKSNGQKDKQDSNGTKMSTYLRRFSS